MGSCKILEYRRERFISDDAAGITAGEKRRDFTGNRPDKENTSEYWEIKQYFYSIFAFFLWKIYGSFLIVLRNFLDTF